MVGGDVKLKEWWPNQSTPIKSNSKHCLGNPRNLNKGVSLVLKQISASTCCCCGVMAIMSILREYGDLTALGLPSLRWLYTGKALCAYWCECLLNKNDIKMSTSVDYVNKPIVFDFIIHTESERTLALFLDDRITRYTFFQWFRLKPSSCYPSHRTLHRVDKLFVWRLFTVAVFLFMLINSNQIRKGKSREENKTR